MEKVGENLLLFCRNLPANGAQIFWDTLYQHYSVLKMLLSTARKLKDVRNVFLESNETVITHYGSSGVFLANRIALV